MILRPARPEDSEALAPLVYQAGPRLLDHGFGLRGREPVDYLRFALARGGGIFGTEVMLAGELDGRVVLSLTAYPGHRYKALARATLRSVLAFHGALALPAIALRLLPLARLFETPSRDALFMANVFVAPAHRGRGLFREALEACLATARAERLARLQLDVSDDNPGATATYERCGFVETAFHAHSGRADLPGFRRMELRL